MAYILVNNPPHNKAVEKQMKLMSDVYDIYSTYLLNCYTDYVDELISVPEIHTFDTIDDHVRHVLCKYAYLHIKQCQDTDQLMEICTCLEKSIMKCSDWESIEPYYMTKCEIQYEQNHFINEYMNLQKKLFLPFDKYTTDDLYYDGFAFAYASGMLDNYKDILQHAHV